MSVTTDEMDSTDMIEPTDTVGRRKSIMDMITEKQKDQDFNQKVNVASTLVLEIYRVLMGAFLVLFVPQKCDDTICSLTQNMNRDDTLSQITLGFNAFTMLAFLGLYFIEVKRENKLINYLEVNRFTPVDNESVGESLEKLSTIKKQNILDYDGYYQKAGYFSTGSFIINAVLSSIVVYSHYLDNKTLTVYLTNLLFMGMKVVDVYSTVNTKKNIFYSAYLKNKVQFNDVDPDKIQLEDNDNSPLVEELSDSNESLPTIEDVLDPSSHAKGTSSVKFDDSV
jgi:hypothetical protein